MSHYRNSPPAARAEVIKAVLSLMVIPPLMMELLVGNLSLASFFSPLMLAILFIGYSLPVVLLRELSIKWRLGAKGVFVLGIIYGIINEGLGAKTLLSSDHIPTPSFNDFGFCGINFPFAAYVLVIQSLVSVVIPILLVHHFYPGVSRERWLGKKTGILFSAMSITGITWIFFSPFPAKANPVFFPVFLVCMALLALLARALPASEDVGKPETRHIFIGMAFVLLYGIGLDMAANIRVPLPLFFLLWSAVTVSFQRYYSRLLFGLGVYILFGLTGIINNVVLKGHAEGLISGLLLEAWFAWIVWRYLKARP